MDKNGQEQAISIGLTVPQSSFVEDYTARQEQIISRKREKLAKFGPYTGARLWQGIHLNLIYVILILLVVANTVIAVLEGLDALFVGFRLPLIDLVFHIFLFLAFVFFTLWNAALVRYERVMTEKMIPAIIGFLFSVMNLAGTIAFVIWAFTYNGLGSRVQFTSDPIGFISLGVVSGVMFLWYNVNMGAWLLLLIVRYNHSKTIEMLNIVTENRLTQSMILATRKQTPQLHKHDVEA